MEIQAKKDSHNCDTSQFDGCQLRPSFFARCRACGFIAYACPFCLLVVWVPPSGEPPAVETCGCGSTQEFETVFLVALD